MKSYRTPSIPGVGPLLLLIIASYPHATKSFSSSTQLAKGIVSGLTSVINFGKPPDVPVPARVQKRVMPDELLAGLRADFVQREYLWSGQITPELYAETCEFSDPTLSFTGLSTFLTNIANLDPILEKYVPPSNRRVELKSIDLDRRAKKVVAEWRMVGDLALPWKPRIDLNGRTAFSYDDKDGINGGRIVRYDETWKIPPAEALLQILQPRTRDDVTTGEGK